MNKTEHKLRLSFDPEYSDKYEKLKLERNLLFKGLVSHYSGLGLDFWGLLLISIVLYAITRYSGFLILIVLFSLAVIIPAFHHLYKYSVVRKRLGL